MNKKQIIITFLVLIVASVVFYFLFSGNKLKGSVVFPYVGHQKPVVDPHLPDTNPLSDKLDEVVFDGLFNISSNPSGIIYEDGLGSFVGIDENDVVTIKLKPNVKWASSFKIIEKEGEITIEKSAESYFSAKDVEFTLRRIENLGSLSPDYILVSQALEFFGFSGPNENNEIKFKFKSDRIWNESDIKEVLSFKIIPANSEMNALNYQNGTSDYFAVNSNQNVGNYIKNPEKSAFIEKLILKPFVDNSTFPTELQSNSINVMLETPFGANSPILEEDGDFFSKSGISTTFFALLFNTERLNLEQRKTVASLIDNKKIIERFYKVGTQQQRQIVNIHNQKNKFYELLNFSIFPSSSYYVEEQIVIPTKNNYESNLSALSDSVIIGVNLNYGFREELNELVEILNSKEISKGKLRAKIISNEQVKNKNYDVILLPISGYRSNFLFNVYDIFLREPNLETRKINLITENGEILNDSFSSQKNFFGLDFNNPNLDSDELSNLLKYVYGFMNTREIGDKQAYAIRIDKAERNLVLASWLFSLPSRSYFSNQFDEKTINIFGVSSQLSTIEKWKEKEK